MDILGLFWLPNWLLVVVAVLLSYYLYMTRNYGVFKKLGINGPKPAPIIGNFGDFLKKDLDPTVKWYHEYNKVWGCFETRNPVLMVGDPEMLKVILVKDFHLFTNRRFFKPLGYPMDYNMTSLEDDQWKHVRNMVSPTFSGGKLRKMMPLVDQACLQFVNQIETKVEKGEDVEIKEASSAFTLEVIASTSFGIQIDTQKNPDDPFILTAKKFFEINFKSAAVLISVFFPFVIPIMEVFKIYFIPQKYSNFFVKVMDTAIEKKKSESVKRADFLQLMMDVRRDDQTQFSQSRHKDDPSLVDTTSVGREGLTMAEIHGQGIGFFLAAYDTMSKALAFTLFNLAHHPQCLEQATKEVDKLLPKHTEPTFESVSELKYVEMCVLETLRLYPPASRFERVCGGDTEVKGVRIPKGMVVAVPVRAIHLDPDIWPDPRTFNPDRFTPEARAQMNPYTFMPFGYGPRNCIGMRFALMIVRLAIARIIQNYKILPSDKTKMPIPFKQEGMLGVEGGLWVSFEKRV